jgi:hypothetical protein
MAGDWTLLGAPLDSSGGGRHPDMLDGASSPTGEAADMDLAIALGRGPAGLVDGNGLDWEELEALLAPLARSRALIGVSVSDLAPDRDPDGTATRRTVALLTRLLGVTSVRS